DRHHERGRHARVFGPRARARRDRGAGEAPCRARACAQPRGGAAYSWESVRESVMTEPTAHVLALDDDPEVRRLVAEYLSQNDLRVTAVATGAELAEAMAHHAIDLVVLDLRLQARTACRSPASCARPPASRSSC